MSSPSLEPIPEIKELSFRETLKLHPGFQNELFDWDQTSLIHVSSKLALTTDTLSGIIVVCLSYTCPHCQDEGIELLHALVVTAPIYHKAVVVFCTTDSIDSFRNDSSIALPLIAQSTTRIPAIHFIKKGHLKPHMLYQGELDLAPIFKAYVKFIKEDNAPH